MRFKWLYSITILIKYI